jgi:hypothetical protein
MSSSTTRDRELRGEVTRRRTGRRSRRTKVFSAVLGCVLAGGTAFAATNWIVGLNSGSSGQAQSSTISNISITASASPSPTNLLYPGSTGDAVITISNSNVFPVTITALSLPANTTYATGYTDSSLSSANVSCTATTSAVSWNFATASAGTSHTLTSALTVAASGTLVVTLTNSVVMGTTAPAGCASTFFSMPSFTTVTATSGTGAATPSPATAAWTN